MRHISNPFVNRPDYNCFACSPDNENGLRMSFSEDGDDIICSWSAKPRFVGYGGIVHGGIQATLHDEIASWVVFVKLATAGFTERLEIDYRSPVRIEASPLMLRSRLEGMDGNRARIQTSLFDAKGKLGSESLAVYFTMPST